MPVQLGVCVRGHAADRPPEAARRETPRLAHVSGVAAAGDVEAPGGRTPGRPIDDAHVGEPASETAVVVVAVVGGSPGVGSVAADADLIALPVVLVMLEAPWLHPAEPGGVLVVEPVLEVEVAGALSGAVVAHARALFPSRPRTAVDCMDEGHRGLARLRGPHGAGIGAVAADLAAAGAKVDRQRGHPRLVDDLGGVVGDAGRELGAVGGDELTVRRTGVGEIGGT